MASGVYVEHENPALDVFGHSTGIRENPKLLNNKGESTKCLRFGGGPSRSSDEAFVMKVEPRGWTEQVMQLINFSEVAEGEEPSDKTTTRETFCNRQACRS